jgi:hypothetical protein
MFHLHEFPSVHVEDCVEYLKWEFLACSIGAVSLRLVMSLYVEIQARMASWVIVRTCVRLRVLFAGALMGANFVMMPNLAIRCNQRG